ncbi:MAG TPA: hypothetical protein VLT47_04310 [Anaeromyxobacteraceae bacterium]|nr:hypothetical protein [Anaeromyxobacteraceae bacterium]
MRDRLARVAPGLLVPALAAAVLGLRHALPPDHCDSPALVTFVTHAPRHAS